MSRYHALDAMLGSAGDLLKTLYGGSDVTARYERLWEQFVDTFGGEPTHLFSAPGRTEIGGNHTDHENGMVLAGSVDLDTIAAVRRIDEPVIRLYSEGHRPNIVDLTEWEAQSDETGNSSSLVRGIAARFYALCLDVGGFEAVTTTQVLRGSGLSSSAAFEVLVGTILNHLYNGGRVPAHEVAKIGHYAENVYFGKPSGLMDQTASAVGGAVFIDFEKLEAPRIERLELPLREAALALCIVDTGAGHADLTHEYAAITEELDRVCALFGKSVLREVPKDDFLARLPEVRRAAGDRAVLRALHTYADNERVLGMRDALLRHDFERFLALVRESGRSSCMYLQNVVPLGACEHQEVALTLALCDELLGEHGAFRVHGGGFAGTVQAFVPLELLPAFRAGIEAVLGKGRCYVLNIRPVGGTLVAARDSE